MFKGIIAIAGIWLATAGAWMILGSVTTSRSSSQDVLLKGEVGKLWGTVHHQEAPEAYYERVVEEKYLSEDNGTVETKTRPVCRRHVVPLDSSDIDVRLQLEHRKKGLLWYATYGVTFHGLYRVKNTEEQTEELVFAYKFPTSGGIYDNFVFTVNGRSVSEFNPSSDQVLHRLQLKPNEAALIEIGYRSQGMDQWWYDFGSGVARLKNFSLTMHTDFEGFDFPEASISPTSKSREGEGSVLSWSYENLITGTQIGLEMPRRLNPGPFVSKISFFAPVSLLFFFFLLYMVAAVKGLRIHAMNYFFLAAAFFAFHLLMAYLVDHINIHLACAISSVVSFFLVVSYMRLVVGTRLALVEVGLSQFVYLVLFSYAFFLEGYTGLAVTICSIITLFVVMQYTGRIDWEKTMEEKSISKGQ